MNTEKTIQAIAQKTEPHMNVQMIVDTINRGRLMGNLDREYGLRGWLTAPETLKAVYGEKVIAHSHSPEVMCHTVGCKTMWKYHAQLFSTLSLEEILAYYEKHLEL